MVYCSIENVKNRTEKKKKIIDKSTLKHTKKNVYENNDNNMNT